MPLIPQQDIVVVAGPYPPGQSIPQAAAEELRKILSTYPPCRIVSITAGGGPLHAYNLTAVIETV